jgi:hypothetical protein
MDDLRKEHSKTNIPIPFTDRRLTHNGVEINYFEITDNKVLGAIVPAYAFIDDTWVISTSVDGLKKVIDASVGKSLRGSAEFGIFRHNSIAPASGWVYVNPRTLAMEYNTNATAWNENLVKIGPHDTPLDELRYRPDEQARYQNALREEQWRRKKSLDSSSSALYNLAPSTAVYRETEAALEWEFHIGLP